MMRLVLSLSFITLAACKAPVGVNSTSVSRDSGPRCAELCGQVGMPLDSVVIMADNVGCVCRAMVAPPPAGPAAPGAGQPVSELAPAASSAGGMAAIMIHRQRQQQAEASRRSAAQRR